MDNLTEGYLPCEPKARQDILWLTTLTYEKLPGQHALEASEV
jgi:hypothetical protein